MNYNEGDIKLFMTKEGFDINVKNNFIECTTGFESAIFLSIFGGNEADNNSLATEKEQFWGNLLYNSESEKYRSRTLEFLNGSSANAENLQLLEKNILLDLNWLIEESIADEINVYCSIPAFNELKIEIEVLKDKKKLSDSVYELNWKSQ